MLMSSTCDQGRSRLLPGAISLLLLLAALAIAAGWFAPAADAKKPEQPELTKCHSTDEVVVDVMVLKVKNISCEDALFKITRPFIKSWFIWGFTDRRVQFFRHCNTKMWVGEPGNMCRYMVSNFNCYGTTRNRYVLASDCTKWNQRFRKNQRVDWVMDRRHYG